MRASRSRAPVALACLILFAACAGHSAVPPTQSNVPEQAHKKTFESGGTTLTLTPNFNAGFGPVPSIGSDGKTSSPAPGPNARLDGGNIDFGTISPGIDYYYRYGMELSIVASSSYQVVGAISGALAPGIPANLLEWLTSNSAHYSLTETSWGGLPFGSPGSPLVIASGSSGSVTLKYDYILLVPNVQQSGASTAQISYTVIP